jgi:carbon-monoxide dehydrogenase medium subunit
MKTGVLRPDAIVNIKRIPDLDSIKEDGDGGIIIGALTTISKLADDPLSARRFGSLSTAAQSIGSYQVRNLATVGGNLCNAAPSADMAPPLIAMDSKMTIASPSGFREMDLQEFFTGPGKVNLRKGELLTEIRAPFPPGDTRQIYLKHSLRKAMDIAMVGVAVSLSFEEKTGVCQKARVVLGKRNGGDPRWKNSEGIPFQEGVGPSERRGSADQRYPGISQLPVRNGIHTYRQGHTTPCRGP